MDFRLQAARRPGMTPGARRFRPRVDTPNHRPTLKPFRGELREELRVSGGGKPFEPDPGHAGEGTGIPLKCQQLPVTAYARRAPATARDRENCMRLAVCIAANEDMTAPYEWSPLWSPLVRRRAASWQAGV